MFVGGTVNQKLVAQWKKEEQIPFKGWDFSYLEDRLFIEEPPWSYERLAQQFMRSAQSMLDMGTGGGEELSSLAPFPKKTVATEGYAPNVALARKKLEPLGITVVDVAKENPLPFQNKTFDLILNRHEAFDAQEVHRLLKPKGIFLTQQVGGDDLQDLISLFSAKRTYDVRIQPSQDAITRAGFTIKEAQEWRGKFEFKDVSAVVYYLKAIPWIVPGFSVAKYRSQLTALQKQVDAGRPLVFTQSRFYILAQKP